MAEPDPIWKTVLRRLREEPVLLFGLAAIALSTLQGALDNGLEWQDALIPVALAVLTFLGRELVVPTVKIVEPEAEKVAEPYYGEDQDVPLTPIDQDEG